jgi:hypothetical protein
MKPDSTTLQETAALLANIEPLLSTEIRTAEHHGLDQIRISVPRAREIHRMVIILEKRLKNILATTAAADNATDRRLNAIFDLN